MTGASLGHDIDKTLTEAGILARRLPFQSDATLRAAINRGEVMFIDQHLSETVEQLRSGQLSPIDYAVVGRWRSPRTAASCRPPPSAIRRASRSSPRR